MSEANIKMNWWTIVTLLTIAAVVVCAIVLRHQQNILGRGIVKIGDDISVTVEVAATDGTKARGLSGREGLATESGMLFLFDQPSRYVFWMKDMKFPLDAVWIRDGEIVDLSINLPAPVANDAPQTFMPITAVDAVLEVPAGFVTVHGLRLGLPVSYQLDK